MIPQQTYSVWLPAFEAEHRSSAVLAESPEHAAAKHAFCRWDLSVSKPEQRLLAHVHCPDGSMRAIWVVFGVRFERYSP